MRNISIRKYYESFKAVQNLWICVLLSFSCPGVLFDKIIDELIKLPNPRALFTLLNYF